MKLKKATDKIYNVLTSAAGWICLVFILITACCNIFISSVTGDMSAQIMSLKFDNPVFDLPVIAVILLVIFVVWKAVKQKPEKGLTVITIAVCVWYFVCGAFQILTSRCVPSADAMTVYEMAEQLSDGNLGFIDGSNSYLSYYPQQIGLTVFLALFIKLMKFLPLSLAYYHYLKFIYAVMIAAIMFFQYECVKKLWHNDSVSCAYIILSAFNVPLMVYSTFIYSEVPALCFFSVGLCFLIRIRENKAVSGKKAGIVADTVISIAAFVISVFIRKNILILIIAVLIVTLLLWIDTHEVLWIIYTVACALACVMIQPAVLMVFEAASGRKVLDGVTALSYLAMGMQENEGTRGPGWYNGFNITTYENSGFDTAKANEISRAAISERMSFFRENPGEMLSFYLRKYLIQWTDGTYACLQATQATVSSRTSFWNEIYYGKFFKSFNYICNGFQTVLFVGGAAGMWPIVAGRGRKKDILKLVFAIGVFGGFAFHMIWEANSRYILSYAVLVLPYAAAGLGKLLEYVPKKVMKNRSIKTK